MTDVPLIETPIRSDRLRDIVAALEDLARPFTIYTCGASVAIAPFLAHPNTEVIAIVAGVATGVSYFRSKDKQASIGKQS